MNRQEQLTEALRLFVGPDAARNMAGSLLSVVDRMAADEVRSFYLDAADEATRLGRRGPNSVADWLLDIGNDRFKELGGQR